MPRRTSPGGPGREPGHDEPAGRDELAEDLEAQSQLVVIGSSAGGVEALSTLVSTLPTDFPAPIVIAQHLEPTRLSHLGEILARRASLPVRTVADRGHLEPGVVFVVPANRQVEISDSDVQLHEDGGGGPMPLVDLLLTSAARAYGERLIAVILTGTGSDGAAGAREVKTRGGTVVIQNPETASYPSMPQSLAPSTVDILANLESIGQLLYDLLTGAYLPAKPDEDRTLRLFLDQLRERSGIDFSTYKRGTILRRLQRRMVDTGRQNLRDYVRYVVQHPQEYQRLIGSFLIKVTEFFRDPELFSYLRDQLLPELIEAAREGNRELRLWSAGCATGEEAYSVAIVLAELLGEELESFNIRIFATDVDADAIGFARHGVYPGSTLINVPPDLVARYFVKVNGDYAVAKRVHSLTVFGHHDLGQRAPFPRLDLTLCRNVLIYFTPELQRRALQRFAFSLREGGALVLGKSETTSPVNEFFTLEHPRLRVYRRNSNRVLVPPARIRDVAPTPKLPARFLEASRSPGGRDLAIAQAGEGRQPVLTAGEIAQGLLVDLPLGVALVDRHYDIQDINTVARRLLGIHTPAIGDDFVHLAKNLPSAQLRAAIDAALGGGTTTTTLEAEPTGTGTGEPSFLEITCHPQRTDPRAEQVDSALVVIRDVTEREQRRRELEQAVARKHEETERLRAHVERIAETNRQLLDANQELTRARAAQRSAFDQLLVTSEEAQAAMEEAETLNEELQASNEELETLNEELQATVEELDATNDDLEARGQEVRELAETLEAQRRAAEAERARLAAILASMADAVMVVDHSGTPVLTNAAYDRLFIEAGGELVPEDEDGRPLPADQTPQARAARGESFSVTFAARLANGTRPWFEANGRPTEDEATGQACIVIRDITERSLRRLQEEFLAMASHELRTPLTALHGCLDMILRLLPADADERARHYAMLGLTQSRRLATLVSDLMDVTRLDSGKLNLEHQPVDLRKVVSQAVELAQPMAEGQKIELEAGAEAGSLTVSGDAGRLEQVVLNLLSNAIKYASGTERIDVRLARSDGEAEIQIRDYGPGIPDSEIGRIFSRFYQVARGEPSKESGLGLGLYIANELVAAHGGTITVESEVGRGSTFTVRLPLMNGGANKSRPCRTRRAGA